MKAHSAATLLSHLRSYKNLRVLLAVFVVIGVLTAGFMIVRVQALSITTLGVAITQNFDTLATTGTTNPWADDTTLPGWYSQFSATPANPTTYRADNGSSNTGAIYSWGVAGINPLTERAFGSVSSGTPVTIFNALKLTNNTGSTITSFNISFVGEQWRQGGCAPTPCTPVAQKIDFQYQVANAGVITDANSPTTSWIDQDTLDFTTPQPGTSTAAAIDGNAAANRTAKSDTLTVTVNAGQEIWLRWMDINDANNDHGLSIDDFSVTPQGSDSAPSVSSTTPANSATGVATNADVTINFSEPVNVTPGWFQISCASSGLHTAAESGGPSTFTLNPNADFTDGEVCTVTIDDLSVSDQDAIDPPNNMTADHVFSFTVISSTPVLSISDVSQAETNAGTTTFTFNVSLSVPAPGGGVTFDIATADGTAQDDTPATEDNDYVAQSLVGQTITSGNSTYMFSVTVNGDTNSEPNETFLVNVTNIVGATPGDTQGQGTIQNDDVTPIHDIQGSGASSPLSGSVSTRGVVTLLKSNGYFLQEPDATVDGNPNTSEGIFVFTSSAPTVVVGDNVTVTGTISEFGTTLFAGVIGTNTELITLTSTVVNSTGNGLPTAITLDSTILDPTALPSHPQLEKYEDMRMTGSLKTVAPNDTFSDVYTVLSSVTRPIREIGLEISLPIPSDPSSTANIPRWDENAERLSLDLNGRAGSSTTGVTSNVSLGTVTGPLDFAFGEFHLIPDVNPTASANMSAVPVPTPLVSEFTVGCFNIENFANGATQRQKAARAIRQVMRYPDIIGHEEIATLAGLQALATEVSNQAIAAQRA